MGRSHSFSSASLQTAFQFWGRSGTSRPASALTILAKQVLSDPYMAGENWSLLETAGQVTLHPGIVGWERNDRITNESFEIGLFVHNGSHSTLFLRTLTEALRAERRWRTARETLKSWGRPASGVIDLRALAVAQRPTNVEPVERYALLASIRTSGIPALNALAPEGLAAPSLPTFGPTVTDLASVQADLAYWRRTADELWRVLDAPVATPPETSDVVLLDTAPCGIRRLTAVRVPRAPGSERTSQIPNSNLLAAA